MDSSRKKIVGRNATLVFGKDGVTIERSARFALQHGGSRKTTLRYQDLGELRHHQAASRPGYLQFTTKQGVEGVTPLSRVNKIHFDREESHKFRRARDIIDTNMKNFSSSGTSGLPHLVDENNSPRPPAGSLSFRRRT